MSGIYIHIPFCKQSCHYCDFYFSTTLKYQKKIINSINKELEIRKNYLNNSIIKSIYIGGGTPSLIKFHDLNNMLNNIKCNYTLNKNLEITVECNPEDIKADTLKRYKKMGVNRISLGVQSFCNKHLKISNRAHDSKQAHKAIELILKEKFKNFSIDLIYGFPNMKLEEWKSNLKIFLQYNIPHLSAYCLTIEKNTVFNHYVMEKKIKELGQKKLINMFLYLMTTLKNNNYHQYEISNFSIKGYESIHNFNYWKRKKYIGIGPSAHSYNYNNRQWNISNNIKYIKSINNGIIPCKTETLSEKDKFNEYILTSIRTSKGIKTKFIEQHFNKQISNFFNMKIKKIEPDFIIKTKNNIILTNQGKCFADKITRDLFYLN